MPKPLGFTNARYPANFCARKVASDRGLGHRDPRGCRELRGLDTLKLFAFNIYARRRNPIK